MQGCAAVHVLANIPILYAQTKAVPVGRDCLHGSRLHHQYSPMYLHVLTRAEELVSICFRSPLAVFTSN